MYFNKIRRILSTRGMMLQGSVDLGLIIRGMFLQNLVTNNPVSFVFMEVTGRSQTTGKLLIQDTFIGMKEGMNYLETPTDITLR